jgi:hypothetical protein
MRAETLRRALITAPATFLAIPLFAAPLAAQTPQEVQKAADDAIHRLGLQTELPRGPEPFFWHWGGNFSLPDIALWIVVAIAVGALLYAFRDTLSLPWRSGGGAWAENEGAIGGATPSKEEVIIEAADELAAAGRFVDAMHMLLLQGLAHMRARLDEQLSDSLTSREILHSTKLPEAARISLRDVVTRVELTYFGRQPAGLADYTACRESFNALARSLYGSAAA